MILDTNAVSALFAGNEEIEVMLRGEGRRRGAQQFGVVRRRPATRLIAEAFGDETAKAWLFGSNSQLGGEAPAFVLRNARLPEDVTPIVLAASGFVESGHGAARLKQATEAAGKARGCDEFGLTCSAAP